MPARPSLESLSRPLALLVAAAFPVLAGIVGEVIDLALGTQGWWIALGSLGLCFGALFLAAHATRAPVP